MLPFSSKGESSKFNKERRKSYAEISKICAKNKSIHEILKKEKEICASFTVTPHTTKVITIVHDKAFLRWRRQY